MALFLREIDGHTPRLPWTEGGLQRVVEAIEALVELLTPAPFLAETFGQRHRQAFTGWQGMGAGLRRRAGTGDGVDPWVLRHLKELFALERRFGQAATGTTLLHSDLRADNIVVTKDRVFFVDWPGACIGAGWVDLVGFLPSVAMQGEPPPWKVFDPSPLTRGADESAVNSVLAALTRYFVGSALKPPPPGLSTLRPFQRAQGIGARAWLKHRLGGV